MRTPFTYLIGCRRRAFRAAAHCEPHASADNRRPMSTTRSCAPSAGVGFWCDGLPEDENEPRRGTVARRRLQVPFVAVVNERLSCCDVLTGSQTARERHVKRTKLAPAYRGRSYEKIREGGATAIADYNSKR